MWQVEYTNRFLKELAALPAEIRSRIEPIVFQILESDNPFALGYLEKMKGYPDKYSNPKSFMRIYHNYEVWGNQISDNE